MDKKAKFLIFSAVIVLLIVISYIIPHYDCPFSSLFNVYCSACGITRAIRYILQLQIERAFWCNQFFVCSLPLFIYFYTAYALNAFLNKNILPPKKITKIIAVVYIILFILYGVLRNFQAFSYLAPSC